ncbi:hypothetical protein [Blastomonas fulva]|uniref:hypothetical protein n=1 Tax=Blastomonas fulva TaxID=1550728 RepID=UPI0025A4575A|nr:hypothetical protein [Blastomonas fulva]MDM7929330.1 hypothetical protein [Blastomonas fulva]MDM7967790.1 hypothetical protein [Blastomonas fulva]
MQNDRKRISIDDQYAQALGLAAYCFAICEWNAVWSAERLQPGYINTIEPLRKTAGVIANELIDLVNAISDPALKSICLAPSVEFQRLVRDRNGLLHGKPGTAPNGDQRLFRRGQEWTTIAIDTFADEVSACSILLNEMAHRHLAMP